MLWLIWVSVPTTNPSSLSFSRLFSLLSILYSLEQLFKCPPGPHPLLTQHGCLLQEPSLACIGFWHVFLMEAWSLLPFDTQEETIPFIWTLRSQSGVLNWTNFNTVSQRLGMKEREERLGDSWHQSSQKTHDICWMWVLYGCCLWHSKTVIMGTPEITNHRSLYQTWKVWCIMRINKTWHRDTNAVHAVVGNSTCELAWCTAAKSWME